MDAGYVIEQDVVRMEESDLPTSQKFFFIELGEDLQGIYCMSSAFLYAARDSSITVQKEVHSELYCTKCASFTLKHMTGTGKLYLSAQGSVTRRQLDTGDIVRVKMSALIAMSDSVGYDYQVVGSNHLNDTRCIATVVGPGSVWLRSDEVSN